MCTTGNGPYTITGCTPEAAPPGELSRRCNVAQYRISAFRQQTVSLLQVHAETVRARTAASAPPAATRWGPATAGSSCTPAPARRCVQRPCPFPLGNLCLLETTWPKYYMAELAGKQITLDSSPNNPHLIRVAPFLRTTPPKNGGDHSFGGRFRPLRNRTLSLVPHSGFLASRRINQRKNGERWSKDGRDMV